MTSIYLFTSSFISVFLLGLQSQFVRDKRIVKSFFTSIGIGLCQLFIFKSIPNSNNIIECVAFILGGAFGISSSIVIHTYLTNYPKL